MAKEERSLNRERTRVRLNHRLAALALLQLEPRALRERHPQARERPPDETTAVKFLGVWIARRRLGAPLVPVAALPQADVDEVGNEGPRLRRRWVGLVVVGRFGDDAEQRLPLHDSRHHLPCVGLGAVVVPVAVIDAALADLSA